MSKSKKKKKSQAPSKEKWMTLTSNVREFLHILKVLNRFYDSHGVPNTTECHLFRKRMVEVGDPSLMHIHICKIGSYEFLIHCRLVGENKESTWIHVDGIAEERERLIKISIDNHPVFGIACMTDLFEKYTEPDHEFALPSESSS